MEVEPMHVPPEKVLNEELERLIIASLRTLKRSNKKCGKRCCFPTGKQFT